MLSTSWLLRRPAVRGVAPSTEFFGSQIGGRSVIAYSYTDMPWKLLAWDVYYFFRFAWALPYILMPRRPTDSGELDELALTRGNLFCVAVHAVLCVLQLAFVLALPVALLFPLWLVIPAVGLFMAVNYALCTLLNGIELVFHSDPKYAPASNEHDHEQWIFLNGVAVGEHWMKNNLNRLALTFKRPVLGIHNRTSGIVFDVIECLVQRNFSYATTDVRMCYKVVKDSLYDPKLSKVIFILHSQGGIEGGLVLDWLLQELPHDLLAKLEVYTFGNAANHFNNPHRYVDSQTKALMRPVLAEVDATHAPGARSNGTGKRPGSGAAPSARPWFRNSSRRPPTPTSPPLMTSGSSGRSFASVETSSPNPGALSGRAIGHIEHYAHTTDFVALWGVLHFARSATATREIPRFIGRLFARTCDRGGHQFCQHYLDGMFPLARDPATGELVGCAEEGNEFMESEVVLGKEGDEAAMAREGFEVSWLGGMTEEDRRAADVKVHLGESPVSAKNLGLGLEAGWGGKKVKDLSRLWQYRNGKTPPASSISRIATL